MSGSNLSGSGVAELGGQHRRCRAFGSLLTFDRNRGGGSGVHSLQSDWWNTFRIAQGSGIEVIDNLQPTGGSATRRSQDAENVQSLLWVVIIFGIQAWMQFLPVPF